MLIVLDCPGCGKRYEIDGALAGKKSRCKQCGEVFKIPVPTAVSAPPPTSKPARPPQAQSNAAEWQAAMVESERGARPTAGVRRAGKSANSAASGPRTIVLNCPNCHKRYELDAALAGKKSRCEDCREVFTIPVPRGRESEAVRATERLATPALPSLWDSVLDDEPASFKARRGPVAPADDELDLAPPPRAAYPQPIQKTSGSYRHRGNGQDAAFTIAGCYLAVAVLVVLVFSVWVGAAQPEVKRVGQIFALAAFFLHGSALILSLSGSIWVLVIAFSESMAQGLLCLLVPCYVLFFIFSRWEETKGAFVLEVVPLANMLVFGAMGFAVGFAGKTQALTQVAGVDVEPEAAPAPEEPQVGLVAPPGFGQPPDFGQPPGFAPQPRFGARPGFGPRRGRVGPAPGIPQLQRPADLDSRVQQFQARSGGRAVVITFSGLPTNSDPSRGVTARDVTDAIRERARALAPGATRTTWMSRNNLSVLMLAPVDDIQGMASRIDFGTATVTGNQIAVQVSPDFAASVPRSPAEQAGTVGDRGRTGSNGEPEIPPDADAVTRSLIQLKSTETHTKKDGLNRLMRTPPADRLAEVVQAVVPLLDDDDGWLVGDAIKVLVIWKSPDGVPALIKRTNDNRFTVRHEAIKALGKLKDPRGVEPVLLQIKDDGFQVEDALKEMGPIAEPALIERLTNPDSDVRRRVCAILKVIGGKETLLAMQSLPRDPEFSVQVAAKEAMSAIVLRVGPLSAAERKRAVGGASSGRGK